MLDLAIVGGNAVTTGQVALADIGISGGSGGCFAPREPFDPGWRRA